MREEEECRTLQGRATKSPVIEKRQNQRSNESGTGYKVGSMLTFISSNAISSS